MEFAAFSGNCIEQMQGASPERSIVAHALIAQLAISNRVVIRPEQPLDDWRISDARFAFTIEVSNVESPASDGAFAKTAEEVMVPLMAAMAELIGYEEDPATLEYDTEGHTQEQTVIRRERSRRNRLLCLSLHGRCCKVCGMSPDKQYGEAGSIIEVHHLEPVSVLAQPRPYDPRTDLIPLCPSCHRAVHVKKPVPYTPEELREILARAK
jgi:5-methylcytosine-specific restriction protein A